MQTNSFLDVRNVVKRYGAVNALKGVSLTIRQGTIHGLLGENGAGKSTLVRIIAGIDTPTSGHVALEGEAVEDADVRSMEKRGIFLVTQEPMIVDSMTVADNLFLGRWPSARGMIDKRRMLQLASSFLQEAGLDPHQIAGELTAVEKRKLNILRALHSGGRLIILDEPTTALTVDDKRQLFDFMARLKAEGVAFLFISHYNEEILEICDEVSVLRDGNMISTGASVRDMSSDKLSEMVIGRDVKLFHRNTTEQMRKTVWSIRGVRGAGLHIDNLDIGEGEIIGFAGLPGSGARELGRALYGFLPGTSGKLSYHGDTVSLPRHPAEALQMRIAFLSEDRLRDGIVAIEPIRNNLTLSSLGTISKFGWLSRKLENALVERYSRLFEIKAPSSATPIGSLSGGNQQKVCLSRLMATDPKLVILNEPTRGIDVGVKEEVHRMVDRMTSDGVSVIVITSDLDEMLRVVDRVALFVDGRIVSIRNTGQLTKEDVFAAAFSASDMQRKTNTLSPAA